MPFVSFLYLPHLISYSCHIFTFPSVLIFKPLRFKQKISAQILSNICSGKCFEVQCAFSPVLILSKQREIKSSSQMDSIKRNHAHPPISIWRPSPLITSGWYMLSGVKDSMAQEEEGMRQSREKGIEALQTVKTHTWYLFFLYATVPFKPEVCKCFTK